MYEQFSGISLTFYTIIAVWVGLKPTHRPLPDFYKIIVISPEMTGGIVSNLLTLALINTTQNLNTWICHSSMAAK